MLGKIRAWSPACGANPRGIHFLGINKMYLSYTFVLFWLPMLSARTSEKSLLGSR